jgi:hypothetical protein
MDNIVEKIYHLEKLYASIMNYVYQTKLNTDWNMVPEADPELEQISWTAREMMNTVKGDYDWQSYLSIQTSNAIEPWVLYQYDPNFIAYVDHAIQWMTTILEQLQYRSNETHFSTPPQAPAEHAFREMDTHSQLVLERKSRENPATGGFLKEINSNILSFYGSSYPDQLQEARRNVAQLSFHLEQLRYQLEILKEQRYDSQIEQHELQHSRRKTQTHRKKVNQYHKELVEQYEKTLQQIRDTERKLWEWEEQIQQLERVIQQRLNR